MDTPQYLEVNGIRIPTDPNDQEYMCLECEAKWYSGHSEIHDLDCTKAE